MESRWIQEVKERFPAVFAFYGQIKRSILERRTQAIFTDIHRTGFWNSTESKSGPGSSRVQTELIRKTLPEVIQRLGVTSVLDAGCGDFGWMKDVLAPEVSYFGLDLVRPLVEQNEKLYGGQNRKFLVADVSKDPLPRADLVICRDCLVHLTDRQIRAAVRNFRSSGARFLMATHFPELPVNHDIVPGEWRPVNLSIEPHGLGQPLEQHLEGFSSLNRDDKSLAIWVL
jgi:SAM-dependent methyltransferase